MSSDIRQIIFHASLDLRVTGAVISEAGGVLSGIHRARSEMESLGLIFRSDLADGNTIAPEQEIARVLGDPIQTAMAEERIIGTLSKSSGIARAAQQACLLAGNRCKVVSGGWKKMPLAMKDQIRQALSDGGAGARISDPPFIYLDKNYIRILGGLKQAVQPVAQIAPVIAVQVRGEYEPIALEAVEAAQAGANIIMVDTGNRHDLEAVIRALKEHELRSQVRIAFSGNISLEDIKGLSRMDLDILDIGYAILDAPCLPMRFDVIHVE
jgi:nicotinate-nucleotide pyrophosphorylase (carboxylating)